ncbi:hypothetical protein V6Z11_A08G133000 [Gossypium hirsutum]
MNNSEKVQIDPFLGFCLERITSTSKRDGKKPLEENQISMDHDVEEGILIGEEGKKRQRGDIEVYIVNTDSNKLMMKGREMVNNNFLGSAAAKRQAGENENLKLECSWLGESTDGTSTWAFLEVI